MSLLKRLLIPIISLSVFILATMTILSTMKTRNMVVADAKDRLGKAGQYYATKIRIELERPLDTARHIGYQAQADIKSSHQGREELVNVLKEYLDANPTLIGTWIGFDPNAFDGKDASYAGQKYHEKSGRFIPWWARTPEGLKFAPMTLDGDAPLDQSAYYRVPMDSKKEALIEPYVDTVDGKKVMMTSGAVPVIIDGKSLGVAGSDIMLTQVSDFLKDVKPYPSSEATVLSYKGNYVAGAPVEKLTKKAEFPFESNELFKSIQEGKEFTYLHKDQDGKSYYYLVSPIVIGKTAEPWALVIKTDESEVLAGVTELTIFQVAVSLIGIFALAFTVYFIARSISKNVSSLSSELEKSSSMVNDSIEQLSVAGQGLSQSSSASAASLEETVAALEELTSMVKMNSDNAKQAASLSASSSESAVRGEQEMGELMASMQEISKSSKQIEEIINVIDDIAFQTNLLALNASVEAARAGEHGKGFAVVAEAVRTLAQRSAVAAKDITSLIKDSVEKIEKGTEKADKSGEVLKTIVTSVKKVSDLNNEISAASEEQATGIAQISKAMNQLDQSVQSNAASSEEIASTAEEIRVQSRVMKQVTDNLKIVAEGKHNSRPQHEFVKAPVSVADIKSHKKSGAAPAPVAKGPKATKEKFEDLLPLGDDEAA